MFIVYCILYHEVHTSNTDTALHMAHMQNILLVLQEKKASAVGEQRAQQISGRWRLGASQSATSPHEHVVGPTSHRPIPCPMSMPLPMPLPLDAAHIRRPRMLDHQAIVSRGGLYQATRTQCVLTSPAYLYAASTARSQAGAGDPCAPQPCRMHILNMRPRKMNPEPRAIQRTRTGCTSKKK
eukprot:scaffold51125_cov32-Tisochrysis_lutea.AAC.2